MEDVKFQIVQAAREKHRTIFPCVGKQSFEECFTHDNGKLLFWFNTEDNSTHLMAERLVVAS